MPCCISLPLCNTSRMQSWLAEMHKQHVTLSCIPIMHCCCGAVTPCCHFLLACNAALHCAHAFDCICTDVSSLCCLVLLLGFAVSQALMFPCMHVPSATCIARRTVLVQSFLHKALMPLHKPKCVGLYHQQLAYCVTQVLTFNALACCTQHPASRAVSLHTICDAALGVPISAGMLHCAVRHVSASAQRCQIFSWVKGI